MKQASFVHLHVHTSYSMLDGACRVKDLLRTAAELRFPALAITDHGGMFGVVDFYQEALKQGVKPIIGSEFYVAPGSRLDKGAEAGSENPHHLVLLARDETGYRNLLKLSSASYLEGFYKKPRIDRELLAAHAGGLIALSACLQGEPARRAAGGDYPGALAAAAWYRDLFGDAYYLEVQMNGLAEQERANAALARLGKELSIPLVATNDVHYLGRDDFRLHDVLLCISTGKTLADENRMRMEATELYLKSAEEMAFAFRDLPEALPRTLEIAERCNLTLTLGKPRLPAFPLPPGQTAEDALAALAREGFARRFPRPEARYRERLDSELAMINRMGFPGYFLIVQDFINEAKRRKIPVGPGRGSAAGSLVAFCLGITELDPIPYNLLFERFLNPERVSLPDIDVDFCQEKRGQVLQYVTDKYGQDRVTQIITFGTLGAKAAIRDVGRVLGMPYAEVDKIAKMVPEGPKQELKEAIENEPRLKEMLRDEGRGEILRLALKLEGLNRHASTHAAGVVISPEPLTDRVPLYVTRRGDKDKGDEGDVVTQYAMLDVEKVGLVKFDFLGLRTLTLLEEALGMVNRRRAEEKAEPLDLALLDLADPATYELLGRGETDGVFQLESSGMKGLLSKFKPSTFEDLIAILALYRPGPLKAGMVDDFVNRKQGRAAIAYDLPQLEPILRDTYGVLVYQEQVMQIARELAGFSLGDADILRRAMGKKKAEEMESQRSRFLEGAARLRVPREKAEKIFGDMEKFAEYGFNKSHSAAYALITLQTAYLKAHYPREFMAALLTSEMDNTDKITLHIGVCRDMGIPILPPDINQSRQNFTVVPEGVRFGLRAVKNVGQAALEDIEAARAKGAPFRTLEEFCRRVPLQKVNRRVVESLIKAGAFDSFGGHRSQLLAALDRAMEKGQSAQRDADSGQVGLFGGGGAPELPEEPLPGVEPWSDHVKLAFEKESLGFYISGHPLDRYRRELERYVTADLGRLDELSEGMEVRVAGMVQGIKAKVTKKGDPMAFVTLEDLHGSVEMVVFPELYREAQGKLSSDLPLVVDGTLDMSSEKPKIRASRLELLGDFRKRTTRSVTLHLTSVGFSRDDFGVLRQVLGRHRGLSPVRVKVRIPGTAEAVLRTAKEITVEPSEAMIADVEKLLGPGAVTFE